MSWLDNRSKQVIRIKRMENPEPRLGMTPHQWKELRVANERKATMRLFYGLAKWATITCGLLVLLNLIVK